MSRVDQVGVWELLPSAGPHPDLAEGLMAGFGQFVGSWGMDVRFFDPDGAVRSKWSGLWSFAWVLDGRGVQDVLVALDANRQLPEVGARRIGSTLRMFEPATSTWRVLWVGASSGVWLDLKGRVESDRLVIEGDDVVDGRVEWTFTDITSDSFAWTGRTSAIGLGWWTEQHMIGNRIR